MAEWALLILVFAVVAGAWWLNQRYFETWQVAAIWCGAGLIIVIGLIAAFFRLRADFTRPLPPERRDPWQPFDADADTQPNERPE